MSGNRLDDESFRPDLFRELTGIQTLDLSVNRLRIITNRTFAAFPSLMTLMLSYNYIERFDPGAFLVQDTLGAVDLTGNSNLKILRRDVFASNLHTLQYLSLSEMEGLERIEKGAFLYLNSLKYLYMEHVGNLTYWPDDFFIGLANLEEFKMTNVPYVRKLPPLRGQKNLEFLFLPITGIEVVQDDLCAQAPELKQMCAII
ncbi:tsukushi-A-like isoform X2 [Oscarella lobularis]|uniref:tsukushi-A-like isoform X2 n=1 Tax=Oscarella lobularis TaxID=121494 RepID=UPI0033135EBC